MRSSLDRGERLERKKKREEEEERGDTGMEKKAPPMSATKVLPMSVDRKSNLPGELAHIESCSDRYLRPSDGGESAAAATMVVHRLRKSDTNLLGVSRAFGYYDYKSNAELPPSGQAMVCTPEIFVGKPSTMTT